MGRTAQKAAGPADGGKVIRRSFLAVMIGLLLWQTPALASLAITDRQQAATELIAGPRFYGFDSGTAVRVGAPTEWDGFTLEGLQVDVDGDLILGRAGDVAPSDQPWHDETSTSRACEQDATAGVRALTFDMAREIEAGRLQADLGDIRVHEQAGGAAVRFRADIPTDVDDGRIAVETSEAVVVCVYWGDIDAGSISDSTLRGPVVADGGWSWNVWNDAGDGMSLDLVDWSTPSAVGAIPSGSVPQDVCNQCANEIVGFVTPTVSGSYRFFLSADDVGRLEISPNADPAGLAPIVELSSATPYDDFADPAQASAAVELVAEQQYAIRARSKDLEAADHLQIAWALDGELPTVLPTETISDIDGVVGSLTHRRFDLVRTVDLSGPPDATSRIEASQNSFDTCDECGHSISGYVVVATTGTYRFFISSDDEGTLRLSTSGDPAAATRVAWLTNFTERSNWTADASQATAPVDLVAGQVIWLEAFNRDRGGPDHLQVGWSRIDVDPATGPGLIPPEELSQELPAEAPLPSAALGPVEGLQAVSGSFVSAPIDTTIGGSNVFGRLLFDGSGPDGLTAEIEFAADPEGAWTEAVDLEDGTPAPLTADGLRYIRVRGSITATDGRITSLGVERDLLETTSVDAVTTTSVPGAGSQPVLRVRGTIGLPATATIGTANTAGVTSWLEGPDGTQVDSLAYEGPTSHHIGVTVEPGVGPTATTMMWSAVDGQGIIVMHDLIVVVEGA